MLRESVTSEAAHDNKAFTKEEGNDASLNQGPKNAAEREKSRGDSEEHRDKSDLRDESKNTKPIQKSSNFLEVKNCAQVWLEVLFPNNSV